MQEITYPYKGFNNAHEIIEESKRSGKQIRDILGLGLPEDYTQDDYIDAYLREECTIGYIAYRLNIGIVDVQRLLLERRESDNKQQ